MLPSLYNATAMLRSDYGPLERLGGDGSSVYRGRGNDGTFVALRFLRTEDESVRDALNHTVLTASAIRHPMLAAVGGCQRFAGDTLCIVSEYVPGQPLDRWIQDHGLPPLRMTVDFVRRLCLGLHAAHQRELTHGALHPGNLMVLQPDTRPGGRIVAKLLDVGVPVWVRPWPPQLSAAQFLAPELLRKDTQAEVPGIPGDVSTDVYACGALLHYLCTGVPPLQSSSLPQLMAAANVARPIGRPSYVNPDIPSELEDVIMSALTVDPDERIPNCAELALGLGDIETLWSESGVRRRDAARPKRFTDPDAVTPIVNLRSMRHASASAGASTSTSQARIALEPPPLPRGVVQAHPPANQNAPEAVVPRPQTAPTGNYPKLDWPRRPSKLALAFAAAGAAMVAFALQLTLFSDASEDPVVKQLPPLAIAQGSLETAVSASRDRPAKPEQVAAEPADLASTTGSNAKLQLPTFVPHEAPAPERAERARPSPARRVREGELKVDEALSAAPEPTSEPKKVEARERGEIEHPQPEAETPGKRALATPPPFAQSAPHIEPVPVVARKPAPRAEVEISETLPPTARSASPSRTPRSLEIGEIRVKGSMSPAVVRRAIERVKPLLNRCVQAFGQKDTALHNQVELSATIDEIGRARAPSAWGTAPPALNECLVSATGKLVADSPDTGTVRVTWTVEY